MRAMYYVVNTCPEGARNTEHWTLDMIKRCSNYEEAWEFCKSYGERLVRENEGKDNIRLEIDQDNECVRVLYDFWFEEECEMGVALLADLNVFSCKSFFGGGGMLG